MSEDTENRLYEASAGAEVTIFLDEVASHINRPIVSRQFAFQNPIDLSDVLRDPGLERLRIAPSKRYPPKKVLQELLPVTCRLVEVLVKEIGKRDYETGVREQSRNRNTVEVAEIIDASPNRIDSLGPRLDYILLW